MGSRRYARCAWGRAEGPAAAAACGTMVGMRQRMPASRASQTRAENGRARGFSFIEVMIAMAILVIGAVSILALFSVGVHHQVQRRVEERVAKLRPEVETFVQQAVDTAPLGEKPKNLKETPLSQPGYTMDVVWTAKTHGSGYNATVTIRAGGAPMKTLGPLPVTRSTLDPRLLPGSDAEERR